MKIINNIIVILLVAPFLSTAQTHGWSELGGLDALHANNIIWHICSDANGNIYAGGLFSNDSNYLYVSEFNGTNWSELGGKDSLAIATHASRGNNSVPFLCSDIYNNIYATTSISTDYYGSPVVEYNGTSWSPCNIYNVGGQPYALCSDKSGHVYAGGAMEVNTYYVSCYNDTSWRPIGSLNAFDGDDQILSLCSDSSGNIYAAGLVDNTYGNMVVNKYDGTSWSYLGGATGLSANAQINSICADPWGNIYAAGIFTNDSGKPYVAKYDGNSWSELGGLNSLRANNDIESICSDKSGNIYAGGYFVNASGNYYVAMFNGTNWSELGGLNGLGANQSIATLCTDISGNIYAAGGFTNTHEHAYVAKYSPSECAIVSAITGPAQVCVGSSINLTDSFTGGIWSVLDTSIATISVAGIVKGITPGNDTITYVNPCYTDSAKYSIRINSLPIVTLSWDLMVADGQLQPNTFGDTVGCALHNYIFKGGRPSGGIYYGFGESGDTLVSGNNGLDTIYYAYTSSNGCSATAIDTAVFGFCEVGILQIAANDGITLNPNPATTQLFIKTENIHPQTISIYDVNGRLIMTQSFSQQIDIHQLTEGVYFITIKTEGVVVRKKFVKM